jgi:hypothetical protein
MPRFYEFRVLKIEDEEEPPNRGGGGDQSLTF